MPRRLVAPVLALALCACAAAPAAAQTLSPTSAVFPDTPFRADSAPIPFTLANTTGGSLTSEVATSNSYTSGTFKQTNNCGDFLPAGATCTINVVFSPYTLTPAQKSGTLYAGGLVAGLSGKGILESQGGGKKKGCKKKGKKRASAAKGKKKCKGKKK